MSWLPVTASCTTGGWPLQSTSRIGATLPRHERDSKRAQCTYEDNLRIPKLQEVSQQQHANRTTGAHSVRAGDASEALRITARRPLYGIDMTIGCAVARHCACTMQPQCRFLHKPALDSILLPYDPQARTQASQQTHKGH